MFKLLAVQDTYDRLQGPEGPSPTGKLAIAVFEQVTRLLGKEPGMALIKKDPTILPLLWSGGLAYLGYALRQVSTVLGHAVTLKAVTNVPWSRIVMEVNPKWMVNGVARTAYAMWDTMQGVEPLPDGKGGVIDPTDFSRDHIYTICGKLCESMSVVACRAIGIEDNPFQVGNALYRDINAQQGRSVVVNPLTLARTCEVDGAELVIGDWLPNAEDLEGGDAVGLNRFGQWLYGIAMDPGVEFLGRDAQGNVVVGAPKFGLQDAMGPIAQSICTMLMVYIREMATLGMDSPAHLRAMMDRPQTVGRAFWQLLNTGARSVTSGGPGRILRGLEWIAMANIIAAPLSDRSPFNDMMGPLAVSTSLSYLTTCLSVQQSLISQRALADAKRAHGLNLLSQVCGPEKVDEELYAVSRVLADDIGVGIRRGQSVEKILSQPTVSTRLRTFLTAFGYSEQQITSLLSGGGSAEKENWKTQVCAALQEWSQTDYVTTVLWDKRRESNLFKVLTRLSSLSKSPQPELTQVERDALRHRPQQPFPRGEREQSDSAGIPTVRPFNAQAVYDKTYREFYMLLAVVAWFMFSAVVERFSQQSHA